MLSPKASLSTIKLREPDRALSAPPRLLLVPALIYLGGRICNPGSVSEDKKPRPRNRHLLDDFALHHLLLCPSDQKVCSPRSPFSPLLPVQFS